jgi:hypothetical protein
MNVRVEFRHLRDGKDGKPELTYLPRKKGEPEALTSGKKPITMREIGARQCRWMSGKDHGASAALCAQPVKRGSYCEYHRGRAYQKTTPYIAGFR